MSPRHSGNTTLCNNNMDTSLCDFGVPDNNIYELIEQCDINNDMAYEKPVEAARAAPYVEIIEQPAKCALRFRYKCEGRSAGSLPGVNSTQDNKTYPTIRIHNYVGRAAVVVSCVTKDAPFRAHPHNIVGKEGCKKGICTVVVSNTGQANGVKRETSADDDGLQTGGAEASKAGNSITKAFSGLGIQCVKRRDIDESLSLREAIKVDPFSNGFVHKLDTANIDLNVVRLCFQVFIEGSTANKYDVPLTPIVSEPVHDKKAMSDLVISKLSHCSAPATGGREVILLCDRISKDDIQIRFFEERQGALLWQTNVEVSPADVHKQVAICFKTPKYHNEHITHPVMARIQLHRMSDNQVSEPRQFQFLPCESDVELISRKRQKIDWYSSNPNALNNILQQQQQQQQQQHHHHQQPQLDHQQQMQHQHQVQHQQYQQMPAAYMQQPSPMPPACHQLLQHLQQQQQQQRQQRQQPNQMQ